ncbi:metalloregulator ArsR/SmtB family transcription factor [Rhodoferax sp.]|uniref:ArsR/SmtB family transcription factor n=1 Tax=Rhodoferax sp. TaxID=50421 RepID=UPI00262F29BC|nr:metalloregulator ArsR/SmtB family transcription factor [Rhodoferax sp.]MDD2924763.1 metalloregulator ArsR/SmtB family transcription factor [Rhodoferax sp.]
MNERTLKDSLYEQVARIGKAFASPKRLELLEMLAQGEKSVETLTAELSIDVKLASAHLKALREANLVQARRDGKYVFYRLRGDDVAQLGVALRNVAEEHLVEMRLALQQLVREPDRLVKTSRGELLAQARNGRVVVIDVRPQSEFDAAHLPYARSMPLAELEQRIGELPPDVDIVAYCRGPFCLMSDQAVKLLLSRGYRARKTSDGVSEWLAAGFAVETTPTDPV